MRLIILLNLEILKSNKKLNKKPKISLIKVKKLKIIRCGLLKQKIRKSTSKWKEL